MLKSLSIVFFILFSNSFFGQLTGKIIDEITKKPIPFASIFLTDLGTGTVSDNEGKFEFKNEIPNHNKLKINALGYSDTVFEINEQTNRSELKISLTPKHYHLHEVIVSTGTGELQGYSISSVASKPINELNIIPNTNLGEAIANLEGVYNASTGKGIYKPVVRGLTGIRVLTFVNGVRLENQQWGGDHGLGVSSIGIGQVEVIKGPSSLLYGSDALGGVLYLKEEAFAQSNSVEASVNSKFESNSMGIQNGVSFKMSKNNFRFNVFANQQNYADYQIPSGDYVKSSRFKGIGTKFLLGYNRKNWVTKLGYNYSNNVIGIPGHTHDTLVTPSTFLRSAQVREEGRPSQKISNHLISFDNQFFFHNSTLKITLGQTLNKLEEYEKFTIPEIGVQLNTSTYYLRYNYKFSKALSLIGGVQGLYQQNTNTAEAEQQLIPNNTQIDNGVFAVLSGKRKKTNYQLGVRYDNRTINLSNSQLEAFNYSSFNYSAGASYSGKHISLRMNVSSGIRNPHVSELLSEGGHSAAQRYEIGDVTIKPEIGNQVDLSVKYKNEHLDILINPFANFLTNYVYLNPVDSVVDGFQVFNYEQAESAVLMGGEAVFHYHPHFLHDFHLEASFSFVQGQNTEGNTPLSFIPQPRLATQITYNFDNLKSRIISLKNFTVQHQFFANQNRTVDYELNSANYNLFNAGINCNLSFKKIEGELGIGAQNILNEEYIDHLSALKTYQLANPGRNFYVSIKLNINQKIK
ncbi:MAG: TonB-dependent receptor [Flavobacteriales bacterium]